MRLGFVTCEDLTRFFPSSDEPLLTHDDRAAADFLRAQGHQVEPVVWGQDPKQGVEALVVRSPWDYSKSPASSADFLAWLKAQAKLRPVFNSPELMAWNMDKKYLADLGDAGVPVVPTLYLHNEAPEQDEDLFKKAFEQWAAPVVLKPAISAGARDTFLLQSREDLTRPLVGANGQFDGDWSGFRQGRSFLLQPFLAEVRDQGEWSCLFFDQVYSHSLLKRPGADSWLVQDELGGSVHWDDPPVEVVEVAKLASESLEKAFVQETSKEFVAPLYTRVDIIPTGKGPLIGEVELIEPELFFLSRSASGKAPYVPAIELFMAGLERRLGS